MAESRLVEADVEFVKQLKKMGGDTLKKCYQCATCSVVCPISPDEQPFPRKEMIAAQWGLKDRLVGNMDVWLCHYCNDCSTYCPRGAKPGDVLNAVRAMTISEYAWPACLGRIVPDPRYWWLLLAIPVAIFANLVRLVIILLIGDRWGEDAAMTYFHDWASPVLFVMAMACMVLLALILRFKLFESPE